MKVVDAGVFEDFAFTHIFSALVERDDGELRVQHDLSTSSCASLSFDRIHQEVADASASVGCQYGDSLDLGHLR